MFHPGGTSESVCRSHFFVYPLARVSAGGFYFSEDEFLKTPIAANDNHKPVKLLCYRELNETRGISYTRRHLYTLENERKFPRRVALGENRVGWIEYEIDRWVAERAARRAA